MPPRRGIVKSGNAGNSTHPTKSNLATTSDRPPPLFPLGFKDPWSILHERCQKLGWEKPSIDIRHSNDGFSFAVSLSRHNKKTSDMEAVRMAPIPPYYLPTAIEAKHWGATYALYRFCNSIHLNRVLPPGPRDYWNELVDEHKAVLEHKKWMYDPDPFEAKKRHEKQTTPGQSSKETARSTEKYLGQRSKPHYPEVLMATSIRDLVEDAIKQGLKLYPDIMESTPLVLASDSINRLSQELSHLGFNKNQIRDVSQFLSEESPFASILLHSLQPLEAAIEYLVLHVPECDLPQRFLPTNNLSNPFVTAVHSGQTDIKRRWVEEKAAKEGGWPASVVRECTEDKECIEKWDRLLVSLGQKLLGRDIDVGLLLLDTKTSYEMKEEEFEAFGGQVVESGHLVIQLFSAPIAVHVLFSNEGRYPRPGYIPIYLTSTTIPAYIRLHLVSRFLEIMALQPDLEDHEGFCMAIMRVFEGEWAVIEDHGPPDMSTALKHVIAPRRKFTRVVEEPTLDKSLILKKESKKRPATVNAEVKRRFLAMQSDVRYQNILRARSRLPAFAAKDKFLSLLEKSRVVVVVGETGCGKTTQLPQFILDTLITSEHNPQASILVTQPRRLSAISVATRVSEERLNDGSVGYSIRGESKTSRDTRLLFCTTGVVLRRLSMGDGLQDVSHVVVDEVHERSMDGDFLLLELKNLLRKHSTLKVVLMSATINHEIFVKYFDSAPLLMIPGFTHPVTDNYLEDFLPGIGYKPPTMKPAKGENVEEFRSLRHDYLASGIADSAVDAIQTVSRSDRIDYKLIASLVGHIVQTAEKRGGILIFLPGVGEMRQCIEAIQGVASQRDTLILPLHANLSNTEQSKVFEQCKTWKIIVATNVAETSITIDDVIYVIDTGKVKETRYDPETNLSRLVEVWVTRAGARQRRGRAGRTQPGICYKLYTRRQEKMLAEFPIPEILRVPLESVSLSVKASKENQDVKAFLSQAIEAPSLASMDRAWNTLVEIGAVDGNGHLTALGRHMSLLPMDVRLAKMLILGTIFRCLGPIVTVVALLSSKPLFLNPLEKRDEARAARKRFFTADSDLLTDVKAFDECMRLFAEGQSHSNIRGFCEDNYISASTVREVRILRQDFVSTLAEIGFIPIDATPSSSTLNASGENLNLVKAVILGGLWPRVARIHLPKENIKFDKVSAGTIQRDNAAKDFKIYDLQEGRVFLHPGSLLFDMTNWKPPFLVYFLKHMTTKIFLRDASKVPIYALLLFGGQVSVNHIRGGLSIGNRDNCIKVEAIPRIGILVNQLRRLLDAQLQKCIEDGTMLTGHVDNPILHAIMALLTHDGMTE